MTDIQHIEVPDRLKRQQEWFAGIICRPLDEFDRMPPLSPSGVEMELEAARYLSASPSLLPHQRIEIYCQQYWWRLLAVLQEMLPLTLRLLGRAAFNRKIGRPYLSNCPPDHWSLNELGNRLEPWMEKEYLGRGKRRLLEAARLDLAYNALFFKGELPPVDAASDPELLIETPLKLQPCVLLFCFSYPLLPFREQLLKEGDGDFWLKVPLPQLPRKTSRYCLWRASHGEILWEELSLDCYRLLEKFRHGETIAEACRGFRLGGDKLFSWFQSWALRGWLVPADSAPAGG